MAHGPDDEGVFPVDGWRAARAGVVHLAGGVVGDVPVFLAAGHVQATEDILLGAGCAGAVEHVGLAADDGGPAEAGAEVKGPEDLGAVGRPGAEQALLGGGIVAVGAEELRPVGGLCPGGGDG